MRILFPLHGYVGWNGGIDLARLLAASLATQLNTGVELYFAMPNPSADRRWLLAALRRWHRLRAGVNTHGSDTGSSTALRKAATELVAGFPAIPCTDDATGMLRAAERVHADIIFPTMLPLGRSAPPRVGYLFDFQHRHLPHLFADRTIRNRDRQFRKIARDANALVVNSRSVAADAVEFLGVSRERLLVLPFTPYVQAWCFDVPVGEALARYSIDGPYFLVCNHFWAHKDHATALRAFAMMTDQLGSERISLVLTGDPIDHRDPNHYAKLVALARDLGIASRTHFLGLIPKRDQLALMKGCRALLQPTLFEGGPGGGAVYEAIGMDVPAIVSDIPINLEIDTGNVTFFRAGDPSSLAEKMRLSLESRPQTSAADQLLRVSEERLFAMGAHITRHLDRLMSHSI